jgi:hypothetical protein
MSIQSSSSTSNSSSNSSSNTSTSSSNTQITTDFDIFGVGDSINTSNYVYDGQTVLLVNSSASQNSSTVKGTYFDPTVSNTTSTGFTLTGLSQFTSQYATQAMLHTDYSSMQNLIPNGDNIPPYTIDLLNGSSSALTNIAAQKINGTTYNNTNTYTTTMALLGGNAYSTTGGVFGSGTDPTDTEPVYAQGGSSSFLFTGNYYYPQTSDIIIIYMVYTINGTDSMYVNYTGDHQPIVTVNIYNRVISKESMSKGNSTGKVYTAGPINLTYNSSGSYSPTTTTYGTNYNIPMIIADNCTKIYSTLTLVYIQSNDSTATETGYFLQSGGASTSTDSDSLVSGFFLGSTSTSSGSNCVVINTVDGTGIGSTASGSPASTYGHFVVCLSYSSGVSTNYAGTTSYCDLLLKNIWRSPVSVYNTYSSYSVSDMATKQVVVLFGKSSSGATFLVTNSGTPISNITNYAVTPLSNFVGLMNSVITYYGSTSSLVSFFTDPVIVASNNFVGETNNSALILQPLLSGSVINPDSVTNSPNMYYMLLQTNNSANMSVDPTSQELFNNDVGNYFDLQNSSLCATGKINYSNSLLSILTAGGSYLFGNSIYSGETTINDQDFYNIMILPEAQFNGVPSSNEGNLSVYAVSNSPFYTSSSSTSNSSTRFDTTSSTSKQVMTVSNIDIV